MRYYTKEWYKLMNSFGTADMFEPVIDREYTDDEIEELYQDMMEKYVQEENDAYDEPPYIIGEDEDPEDFDPEDYLIGDIDEDGDEYNLRHPENLEELLAYQRREFEFELEEYENRPPFDEEEAREEFEESYRDSLEEPDEDIPEWVLKEVDPRLIAMGLLPEKVYLRLKTEEAEKEEQFDAMDDAAEEALEEIYEELPEEYQELADELDELDGDYADSVLKNADGSMEIVLYGWDEDGETVRETIELENAEVIEDEGLVIEAETDEDGDFISNCCLENHELYYEDGKIELHMLFDNEEHGLKYLTVRCTEIFLSIESE